MTRISIYGKPSYTYDVLKGRVLESINGAELGVRLNEVNSVQRFIEENIDSIPAISVNGEIRTIGKTKLEDFIQDVEEWIFSSKKDSDSKKIVAAVDLKESPADVMSFANGIAKTNDLDLELIHACHPSLAADENYTWDGVIRKKDKELENLIDAIEPNKVIGNAIKKNVVQGLAGDVLIEHGKENEKSLFVFGSRPNDKRIKSIFGSSSLLAINKLKNPILILSNGKKDNVINNVAFAVLDFEADKKSFLKFKEYFKNDIDKVDFISFENPGYQSEELIAFCKKNDPDLNVEFHHISGDTLADSVNEFCLNNISDLLVITKTQKGIFKRLFETSLTKQLALNPITSLLILK